MDFSALELLNDAVRNWTGASWELFDDFFLHIHSGDQWAESGRTQESLEMFVKHMKDLFLL